MAVDIDYDKKKKQIEQTLAVWNDTSDVRSTLEEICEHMDDKFERERIVEVIVEVEKLETQVGNLSKSLLGELPVRPKKTHLRIVKDE